MSITFTNGANSITMPMPVTGTSHVDVIMSMRGVDKGTGKFSWSDNTSTFDYRVYSGQFLLNETDARSMYEFFNDPKKGRGNNVTLSLGASASGFFPGGPDKGDIGNFTIRIMSIKESGVLHIPYLYFTLDVTFVIITPPAYSLPSRTGFEEGDFYVGDIGDLQTPMFGPSPVRGYTIGLSESGSPSVIDRGTYADSYNTTFQINANQPNAAALVNHIAASIRGNSFEIGNADNAYPFGIFANEGDAHTLNAKLTENKISIDHIDYGQFVINISSNLESIEV